MAQRFAREEEIDLNETFVRTVANEYEAASQLHKWHLQMHPVPSAYEPSGAMPARAAPLLLLGSLVGGVVGFLPVAVIGSVALQCVDPLLKSNLHWYQKIFGIIWLFVLSVGAYAVTGWVSAWCTTRAGEWGKSRSIRAAALLSVIASLTPAVVVCACYFLSGFIGDGLKEVTNEVSPWLADWLFHSGPVALIIAVFGIVVAPFTAGHCAVGRVRSVKFCECCDSFMRVSRRKKLTLGYLRGLVRAVRQGRLDVAASLLHGPSGGDGFARLYYCPHCSRGYLEVTVTFNAKWKPADRKDHGRKREDWLTVSRELAAPDAERLRQALLGTTDNP
jgi:hypothetical protein